MKLEPVELGASGTRLVSTDVWVVRSEDVYLGDFDNFGQPMWMPREEARRFDDLHHARCAASQSKLLDRSSHPVVVRLKAKRKAA